MINYIIEKEVLHVYQNNISVKDLEIEYSFIDKNEDTIIKMKNVLKKSSILSYKKYKNIQELKNVLNKLYNDDEIFYLYTSIFLVKSFCSGMIEKSKKKYTTIYDNINIVKRLLHNINIYIRKIKKYEEKELPDLELHEYILKVIEILNDEKIIEKVLCRNGEKTSYMIVSKNIFRSLNIEIYREKFNIINFSDKEYIFSKTFNSLREITTFNIINNPFKLGKKKFLGNLISQKMDIDIEMLKEINKEYKIENNINYEVNTKYKVLCENLISFIKENDIQSIKETSKLISIYQKAILFDFIVKNNIEFCYSPIFIDFRGRVYKGSDFSVTFIKELRLCIYFGHYDEDFFNNYEYGKTDKIMEKYLHFLDELEEKIPENKIIKIAILWYIIGLSENIKSEIGEEISIEKLLEEGIKIYKNIPTLKYEKKIKIICYIKGIKMLLNEKKIKKSLISKDATASVYQHLVKLLGEKDETVLKFCNLNSEDKVYDIYMYIIKKWKEEKKEIIKKINLEDIETYFNRKKLKKVMMTKNYGCGFRKCYKYFFEDIDVSDEHKKKKIGKLLKSFYVFIHEDLSITKLDTQLIDNFLIERNYKPIELIDGSIVDLRYYHKKIKRIDTKYKTERYTHIVMLKCDEINGDKMVIAGKANYIHTQDGTLARDVASKIECLIIHDCFLVGCLEVSKLIDIVNNCMNKNYDNKWIRKNKKKIYSIFIVV